MAFSFSGLPQTSLRKPIGAGAWVSVASPASCRAAIRKINAL
jgi:hypothetical protein